MTSEAAHLIACAGCGCRAGLRGHAGGDRLRGVRAVGRTLSSEGPLRNLAEAAAMGSVSEVARFLQAGEDPNTVVEVRPFAISSGIRRVTGLEAAVWHRSAQLMQLLDRTGAIGDGETRRRVTCLAVDLRVEEIVEYLAPDGASSCVPGQIDRGDPGAMSAFDALRNVGVKVARRLQAAPKPLVRAMRRHSREQEHRAFRREAEAIDREIAALAAGTRPIVAGPWLAEVGYEVLYWIPFLRWFQDAFGVPRDRLVVVSRGGMEVDVSRLSPPATSTSSI